jgi:TusA-related sulfurtransferase
MTVPAARLDLRPFACPVTYVKTRIALGRLEPGQVLEVWLAAGEAVESVPRSAEEDGHRVLGAEALGASAPGAWRVLIEKSAAEETKVP